MAPLGSTKGRAWTCVNVVAASVCVEVVRRTMERPSLLKRNKGACMLLINYQLVTLVLLILVAVVFNVLIHTLGYQKSCVHVMAPVVNICRLLLIPSGVYLAVLTWGLCDPLLYWSVLGTVAFLLARIFAALALEEPVPASTCFNASPQSFSAGSPNRRRDVTG
eukprot:TRINITY_DN25264_c0_g1_i1.p1 TRINITY_DN25264_c0_g1~~TRINITY_DN25264_c0_g1_i1.p1  ORF type:complete len:172 (-),score=26.44 TRINITY_DN25264_c0_g1_i1:48-539(-)